PPGDFIDVHDIESGGLSSRIAFDNGQSSAVSMFYDRNTDTVLTVDIDADMVFERDLDGNFLRSFEVPDGVVGNAGDPIIMNTSLGVTRGPNGEVYATNQGTLSNVPGATDGNGIFVWDASGDFIEFIDFDVISAFDAPIGILYGGNIPIPEPTSVVLLGLGALTMVNRRVA
ncbi:MAG: PEP-CTERM sorting domain-containing protein, partial [Planctomycetota bacterium]